MRVVTLDTGRLFQETYDLMDRTRAMYPGLEFETYFPAAESLEAFVNSQGMSSIFKSVEARKTCCGIRKIDPLHRALEGAEVWVTGLRSAQSDNRAGLSRLERDAMSGKLKYNPLLDWTDGDLDIRQLAQRPHQPLAPKGLPFHWLRPLHPGGDGWRTPRAGRWWWEQSTKECGLHKG